MRKTKIVCTIGPSSESLEEHQELINAGMNVARLNFSHGDFEEHGKRIKNIRQACERAWQDRSDSSRHERSGNSPWQASR